MKSPTLAEDRSGTGSDSQKTSAQQGARLEEKKQMRLELARSSVAMIAGQQLSSSFQPSSVSSSSTSTPHFGACGTHSQTST